MEDVTAETMARKFAAIRADVCATMVVAAAMVFAGCANNSKQSNGDGGAADKVNEAQKPNRKRFGNLKEKPYTVETYDLNNDDEPDQWVYKKNGEAVRRERDMNFDGTVDVWQYLGPEGNVVEEEMDLDLDGTVDLVNHFENGNIKRKEMSVAFDERFSIVKFYNKKGNLLRVERDKDGDGTADVWEYYEKGERARVGWDDNGDGVPDTFNQLPN